MTKAQYSVKYNLKGHSSRLALHFEFPAHVNCQVVTRLKTLPQNTDVQQEQLHYHIAVTGTPHAVFTR